MDLLHARVIFRDRSVSDVLDLALRFLAVHGRRYAKAGLASLVPLAAVCVAAGMLLGPVAAWTVAAPLATVAEIPFTVLASRLVFQENVRTADVLRDALRETPRVLFARGLALVLVFFGLVFFLIPGVWLSVISLFTIEVMLLERSGLGAAIGRSLRIAGSGVSEALLGTIVTWLLPIGAALFADVTGRAVIGEVLQFRPPRPVWSSGWSTLAAIGLFAQVPYVATARFFLYLNIRTRAEGWDIQTRFAGLSARMERQHAERTSIAPRGEAA
jgi:hypothetical protein